MIPPATLPSAIATIIEADALTLVAAQPPSASGSFSLYYAAVCPYRVLHVSCLHAHWRMSWVTDQVQPGELSAITYSFLLKAGLPSHAARREARETLEAVGIPYLFSSTSSANASPMRCDTQKG